MNQILDTILINTYTLSQLKHRVGLLKSYLEQQIFGAQKADIVDPYLKTLPPSLFAQFNKDNIVAEFEKLQSEIEKLENLTIYLTFTPDDQIITQIGEQAQKTFNRKIMLDVKYDPSLIAGAALVWKGVYKDYSLRQKIDERKNIILESFHKFLR